MLNFIIGMKFEEDSCVSLTGIQLWILGKLLYKNQILFSNVNIFLKNKFNVFIKSDIKKFTADKKSATYY